MRAIRNGPLCDATIGKARFNQDFEVSGSIVARGASYSEVTPMGT